MTKRKKIILTCVIVSVSVCFIALMYYPARYLYSIVNYQYQVYKTDMKDKLDVDSCKEDLEAVKEYLLDLRNTVDKKGVFSGSFFVRFKENESGKYAAEAYKSDKILTFECSEDVYTAFKNVLAHASDTAPIVTVLVTKTDIILNTTDLTGDYALVYSPDRNPEKNAINCDYTKKAGNGWYHIWYS